MSPEFVIRPAANLDVPGLIRLLRRSWLVTWAPELPFEAVQAFATADPARHHAENGWHSFKVAVRENELLGMVHTDHEFLESLHVDLSYWSAGVGSRLLGEAEQDIARISSVARLEVRSFNKRARAFYANRGWIVVRQYLGTECGCPVDNFEMQKSLQMGVRGGERNPFHQAG